MVVSPLSVPFPTVATRPTTPHLKLVQASDDVRQEAQAPVLDERQEQALERLRQGPQTASNGSGLQDNLAALRTKPDLLESTLAMVASSEQANPIFGKPLFPGDKPSEFVAALAALSSGRDFELPSGVVLQAPAKDGERGNPGVYFRALDEAVARHPELTSAGERRGLLQSEIERQAPQAFANLSSHDQGKLVDLADDPFQAQIQSRRKALGLPTEVTANPGLIDALKQGKLTDRDSSGQRLLERLPNLDPLARGRVLYPNFIERPGDQTLDRLRQKNPAELARLLDQFNGDGQTVLPDGTRLRRGQDHEQLGDALDRMAGEDSRTNLGEFLRTRPERAKVSHLRRGDRRAFYQVLGESTDLRRIRMEKALGLSTTQTRVFELEELQAGRVDSARLRRWSERSRTFAQVDGNRDGVLDPMELRVGVSRATRGFAPGLLKPLAGSLRQDGPVTRERFLDAPQLNDRQTLETLRERDLAFGNLASDELFVGEPDYRRVRQGRHGTCFFLSDVIGQAAHDPSLIKDSVHQNEDGSYTVKLGGSQRRVEALTLEERTRAASAEGNGLWLAVMEKGLREKSILPPGYATLGDHVTGRGYFMNPPFGPEFMREAQREQVLGIISRELADGKNVIAGNSLLGRDKVDLVNAHAYAVLGVEGRNIRIMNPHGAGSPEFRDDGRRDGIMVLSVDEFIGTFEQVFVHDGLLNAN